MPEQRAIRNLIWILGDQLSHSLTVLAEADPEQDRVLMLEVGDETSYVRHHKQKLVLVLAAMCHFAGELVDKGFRVEYVKLDDAENLHSFERELQTAACSGPSPTPRPEPTSIVCRITAKIAVTARKRNSARVPVPSITSTGTF